MIIKQKYILLIYIIKLQIKNIFFNPTKQDILLDILKLNRAIYYQLKTLTDNKVINLKMKNEKMKEMIKDKNVKGKGVSDDYDVNKLKNIEYKQLKGLIED